jgi:hypothetical protein
VRVISVDIRNQYTTPGGRIRCDVIVVVEADDLTTTEVVLRDTSYGPDADIEALARESALQQCVSVERSEYMALISQGENPFVVAPIYHEYDALLADIIKEVLSIGDPQDPLVYNGHALLTLMDDARLKGLLAIDEAKVAEIREAAAAIASARKTFDSFAPVTI